MNNFSSFIERIVAGLSVRVRAAAAVVVALPGSVFASANPAFGGGNSFGTGMSSNHMNTAWLGDIVETGCVKSTYVAKRIIPGHLREVLT